MNRLPLLALTLLLGLTFVDPANAEIVSETVRYRHGKTELIGKIFYDDALEGPRPGVLVIHEWWGRNDFALMQARRLAASGYVALAADMYGDARTTEDPAQAKEWSGALYQDPAKLRARGRAGLATLAKHDRVDGERLAATGYCFGGTVALHLAYDDAPVKSVAAFHSGLPQPSEKDVQRIKAEILILHGSDDPAAPIDRLPPLSKAFDEAGVNWNLQLYGGARHAFTNPAADDRDSPVVGYDAQADRASHVAMHGLLNRTLAPTRPETP